MEVKLFLKLFILFIKNKFINLNEKLNLEGVLLSSTPDLAQSTYKLPDILNEEFNENSMKFFEKCYILLYQRIRDK